ncbi:OPT oligopeptide transporter protein-domain-containing protein [Aspergillus pseudonomiae]|uniref:OPT oligopeptide transporter protein-domain-containing protein n=1 Tax=Aspergillus pseudonomiae TaxID=1506151 RepID=A0A5N7DD49_9EURO|nr:OPT oligopeptide transporter protein-domain-containing protein [Aspergillus pseudonomiae]KAE8404297.1 OPT oligopeptide transporter protein-domain-containing protein [Aspergillus pseudonomiae]
MSDYARPTGSQPIEMTDMREVHRAGENGTNQRASSITTDDDEGENDTLPTDPFEPFGDVEPATGSILTFRALIVGCFCGTLVNASNLYLGLKAGWTVSANIFGSIIGFALLQPLTSYLSSLGYNSQHFGPQENNIVQTAATAAGGLSNVFVSAIPALYQLGLLATPSKDFARLVAITAAGGYFGLLSAAPLRKFFIFQVARELQLIFPSSSATAVTIRGMHLAASGAYEARQKMRTLAYSFLFAMLLRIVSQYAIGILWDWHIFTWVAATGFMADTAMAIESWGWYIEWTPAFIGSGMLVGMNVAASFVLGSILAWGVIGPYLVSHGLAFGKEAASPDGLVSYFSLSAEFADAQHPSPRYWLLWPGVVCMIAAAFTELFCQWRVLWIATRGLWQALKARRKKDYAYTTIGGEKNLANENNIRLWMWLPGLVVTIAVTCFITSVQFEMSVAETLLALTLAFLLSLLAIHASGATDTVPLSSLSKVTQVVLGGTTQGSASIESAQRLNLLGGALTNIGANQACDLMGDFRVGFLLGTSPRLQYAAQMIGTLVAALVAPTMFLIFASAYPCILSTEETGEGGDHKCEFPAPSVAAWRAIVLAVTRPESPIPQSSWVFSISMAVLASAMVLVKNLCTGKWTSIQLYYPNMVIVAMAFTLPSTQYGTAMLIGAVIASVWKKKRPDGFEKYAYAVAAGVMAGEGIGGVVNAILSGIGLDGGTFGTTVGTP